MQVRKAMPKGMLPIVDKPTIQYIVEEAVESGIEDIIIVTGKGKRVIEDHFDNSFELEHNLFEKGKYDLLNEVQKPSQVGLGLAIWCARNLLGMNLLLYFWVVMILYKLYSLA